MSIDPDMRVKPELIGIHSLDSFGLSDSSARSIMKSQHLSQALTLNNPTEKLVQSGIETELGKYTFSVTAPCNLRIIKIIPRYRSGPSKDSIPFNPETLVIYENTDTRKFGYLSIPYNFSIHQHFGFKYKATKNIHKLIQGEYLDKGDIIADSPSKTELGGYMYGTTLNTALMSHPGTAEDGLIVSEDALKKLSFTVFEKRTVEFGSDSFPLNLYGTANEYKPFPEIGEKIHDSGILMVIRNYDDDNAIVLNSIYDVQEPDLTFDKPTFVRGPGGRVVDIKVYHNPGNKPGLYGNIMDDMSKYKNALIQFYNELIITEEELRVEQYNKFGTREIELEQDFYRLMVEAYSMVDGDHNVYNTRGRNIVRKTYRGDPIDEYRIDFVIEYEVVPTMGYKLTGLHGDKGIICRVEKTENMPVDEFGVRADVIAFGGSTISRMNVGRLYESYISSAVLHFTLNTRKLLNINKCTLKEAIAQITNLNKVNPDIIEKAYNGLLKFYKLTNEDCFIHYSGFIKITDKINILAGIVSDSLYLYSPVDNKYTYSEIVNNLEHSSFKPPVSKVKYSYMNNDEIITDDNVRIAPMYMMLLEKIADTWLSVASAKRNHFGIITGRNKKDKYQTPWRPNPTKTLGETETRLMCAYCGDEAIAEFLDRSNNLESHLTIYKAMLTEDTPTNIKNTIDRNLIPFGNTKPLMLVDSFAECCGFRFVYEEENNE